MERLTAMIFLLGLGLIVEVNPQKWTRSVGIERPGEFRPNEIDPSEVYQRVGINKQFRGPWIHYEAERTALEQLEHEEEELLKMLADSSVPIDIEKWDSVGDRMISRANVSEETKRVVRQVKKQRPGFFWTLFRVTFETVNETRSAIQQINDIVSMNVLPETATSKASLISTMSSADVKITIGDSSNTTTTTTTTEAPFKLTRKTLQSIVRRNVLGLVRLFNIEWKDAIDQSQVNVREFQRSLGKSVQPFLADNPAAY